MKPKAHFEIKWPLYITLTLSLKTNQVKFFSLWTGCPHGEGIIDPENDDQCGPCPDGQGILSSGLCGDCPPGQGIDSYSKVCADAWFNHKYLYWVIEHFCSKLCLGKHWIKCLKPEKWRLFTHLVVSDFVI